MRTTSVAPASTPARDASGELLRAPDDAEPTAPPVDLWRLAEELGITPDPKGRASIAASGRPGTRRQSGIQFLSGIAAAVASAIWLIAFPTFGNLSDDVPPIFPVTFLIVGIVVWFWGFLGLVTANTFRRITLHGRTIARLAWPVLLVLSYFVVAAGLVLSVIGALDTSGPSLAWPRW